ncbi:MAG: MBL fold metallo-hydrolase [Candidatus Bathyarchaeota archaeon]|nr:MBL fold metallo-hydrolase [Candidatus Bathyarchaeota archaeon]
MSFSIKWLGHASFQITVGERNIYIDPYEGRYTDKADLVLVSHSHFDHCDQSKIERIRKEETVVIGPADCAAKIKGKVKVLEPGEKTVVGDITVEAVHAYNYKRFRSPGVPFHPKGSGLGYLITVGGRTIYHAGDTDFVPEMQLLKDIFLALLPNGGTYTMDNREAAEAALAINPKFVMPIHRFNSNPEELKKRVEGTSNAKFILLKPGQRHQFE